MAKHSIIKDSGEAHCLLGRGRASVLKHTNYVALAAC